MKYKDCMLWAGVVDTYGYSQINVKRNDKWVTTGLHRLIYTIERGPVPKGLVLDHLCRNRICINSDHLEPVTIKENIHRGFVSRVRLTNCKRGHEFSLSNTYTDKKGYRRCRECTRIRQLINKG